MKTRLISAATAVMAFTLLFAGNVWAQVGHPMLNEINDRLAARGELMGPGPLCLELMWS